jgi:hypothetical protein
MAKLSPGNTITANDSYDWDTVPGRLYSFSLYYAAGTGTVTVLRENGQENTFTNYKLPTDPTANMALAATGTELGYEVRATGSSIRFTVSLASSLQLQIKVYEINNGRS